MKIEVWKSYGVQCRAPVNLCLHREKEKTLVLLLRKNQETIVLVQRDSKTVHLKILINDWLRASLRARVRGHSLRSLAHASRGTSGPDSGTETPAFRTLHFRFLPLPLWFQIFCAFFIENITQFC